jgi:small subunit ribosomal protein S6
MFILDANRYGRDPESLSNLISSLIQEAGGEILVSRFWEERRLAYTLDGHRKGVYWLTYFKLSSVRLIEIEHRCEISDEVLRTLFLKVDPRIVETLVAHAKAGTIASYSVPEKEETPEMRKKVEVETLATSEGWEGDKPGADPE